MRIHVNSFCTDIFNLTRFLNLNINNIYFFKFNFLNKKKIVRNYAKNLYVTIFK